jgi:phospholipid/cholesterol/gamma-HCH transport system substrate-binding protein
MRSFAERNAVVVGAVGVALTGALVAIALNYNSLPFVNPQKEYSAYFTEAGGIAPGSAVQVSGFEVGTVSSIKLDGSLVLVEFDVDDDVRLGDRTEAAVKTKSLLGTRTLEVIPRGDRELAGPIPAERTTPPYQLTDALGDLATTIDQLDT